MTRPGSTKTIADSVPAADAIVWTMLFSWMVRSGKNLSTAIEMTAAGIDVAKVRPIFRPAIDVHGGEDDGDERAEDNPSIVKFLDDARAQPASVVAIHLPPMSISWARIPCSGVECRRIAPTALVLHPHVGEEARSLR